VVGVLRTDSAASSIEAALASARGGLQAIELTFTTPNVLHALETLHQHLGSGVQLGIGTITTIAQLEDAAAAGAQFLVSPHFDVRLANAALQKNLPYIPGVMTPSEVVQASSLGFGLLKLFPIGTLGGTAYLRNLQAPFPEVRFMVTGGIQPQEATQYLRAGAVAVGLGGLYPAHALEHQDWQAIETITRSTLEFTVLPP
jgi:2-dehydro-3-deoxyphosphogluconate aldolase / (4S)-4-hydroxy-2-oxoglutarate aldolase